MFITIITKATAAGSAAELQRAVAHSQGLEEKLLKAHPTLVNDNNSWGIRIVAIVMIALMMI